MEEHIALDLIASVIALGATTSVTGQMIMWDKHYKRKNIVADKQSNGDDTEELNLPALS